MTTGLLRRGLFSVVPSVPSRVFAIGDIHGCSEETRVLLEAIQPKLKPDDLVVFVGDYIDRGPDSKGVVESLLQFRASHMNTRFLRGNHEDMLLDYFELGDRAGVVYHYNGGVQFFQSYGLSSIDSAEVNRLKLPPNHLAFFEELEAGVVVGDFLIVHAGIHPDFELEDQRPQDLYWIRDEFIDHSHRLNLTVVFGHTPMNEVFIDLPYKIGIDTGLVFGSSLTCVELVEGKLYQVKRGEDKVTERNL